MLKTYSIPVFHTVYADKAQTMLMMTVFDTLFKSNISFCVVKRDDFCPEDIYLMSYGDIEQSEIDTIFNDVADMYCEDKSIKHIFLE